MHVVKSINIQDYTYHLPDERIAKYPLERRDESKLLVYRDGSIRESVFKHLTGELPEHSLLVFNNTRVIHARLLFQRETGAQVEIFCIEPSGADYQQSFSSRKTCRWKCMVGNAKRWKEDVLVKEVKTGKGPVKLYAEKAGRAGDLFEVQFTWNADTSFAEVLHAAGVLPLPPYLNRESEAGDEQQYQTVYAKHQGSVAAPTAGLHFTEAVLAGLSSKQIRQAEVTLHVGAGTFRPIRSETLGEHEMHEETVYVPLTELEKIHATLHADQRLAAVGTTSVRTLESLFWHGVKLINGSAEDAMNIRQWDAYELPAEGILPAQAIGAVIDHLWSNRLDALQGSTQIIIAPGYRFRLVDMLITNFHQPGNSLILLIAAFVGDDWRQIYHYALDHDFRFLSYGDSSLLFRNANASG